MKRTDFFQRYAAERPAPSNEGTIRLMRGVIPTAHSLWTGMRTYEGQDPTRHSEMRGLYTQLVSGLLSGGVDTIDKHGVPFDPNVHNAISTLCSDSNCSRSHYVEIITPGFATGERLIHPASVRVFH